MNLKPVIPFEPIKTDQIPSGNEWIAQVKWDGVRILTYYDGQDVQLYNRRLNNRTLQYPELLEINQYCSASSVIVDGEMIALKNGKPSFHQIMRRDSLRKKISINEVRTRVPSIYMIFDVLYCNGDWVVNKPLEHRQNLLKDLIHPQPHVQLVESFSNSDSNSLFEGVKSQKLEGIVCKNLSKSYLIDGKDSRWQKLKITSDLNAVVGGVTLRQGVVNALLLGLYDEKGMLYYIGHAGTGKLKKDEWRILTEKIEQMIRDKKPFINKPERERDAIWIHPILTVKIQFMEWTEGGILRQPSIQAFVDVPPEKCTFKNV